MPDIFLNDVRQSIEPTPATWGDLLDALDAHATHEGVVLSVARFDGVEEPSFREPAATRRALNAVSRVEVETATPDAFLRSCLLDAIPCLEAAANEAQRLSGVFRGRDLSTAHQGLMELAASLSSLAILIDTLNILGINLEPAGGPAEGSGRPLHGLTATVETLVSAQESEDWLTVADILEYDLEPAIRGWASVLTTLSQPA